MNIDQLKSARIDLHMHSTFSDGSFSPTELIALASKAQLKLIALTDHNTVAGVPATRLAAKQHNIGLISGVEVSAKIDKGACHILGYFVDEQNAALLKFLDQLTSTKNQRNYQIIKKLNALNIAVSVDELKATVSAQTNIGRPHIASLLVAKGYVGSIKEAFQRYLGNHAPAYVSAEQFTASEVILAINNAQGKAFLAHPFSLRLEQAELRDFIKTLKAAGLSGIEVFNSAHNSNQIKFYRQLADDLELEVCGGSDFHGEAKPHRPIGIANTGGYICGEQISPEIISRAVAGGLFLAPKSAWVGLTWLFQS